MFSYCLSVGKSAEREFKVLLRRLGFTDIVIISGKKSEFDCYATNQNGQRLFFEIKCDLKSMTTGNVAVELEKIKEGKVEVSGLSVTTADFYCYLLPKENHFFIHKVSELKELVKGYPIKIGGDNNSVLAIIPVEDYKLTAFDKIYRKDHVENQKDTLFKIKESLR